MIIKSTEASKKNEFEIIANSPGLLSRVNSGKMASIQVKGHLYPIDGGYKRGINVIIFDGSNGDLLSGKNFDTHKTCSSADDFAKLIEMLPLGRIVAITLLQDNNCCLSDRAKRVCALIGSCQIYKLQPSGAWSIFGYKGAAPGSVMEKLNNFGVGSAKVLMPFSPKRMRMKRFLGVDDL